MTSLSLFTFMHWRRKWQPTPVSLPGECQGRGRLVGCRLWDHTESDTTEVMQQHADDTTFMAKREDKLESQLMKVKEKSEKACLKLNIQKTKIMASGPIASQQVDREKMETVTDFIFLSSKNHCRW